jgi:ABC-2 type transport system ATP-binding protein
VLAEGTLDDLLREETPQVRLAVDGLARDATHALLNRFGSARALGDEWEVTLAPGQCAPRLLSAVGEAGGAVRHACFGRRNLEELFMALTRRSLRD